VDTVELPGVDGDEEHAPDSVEIEDLDTTTDPLIVEAETVEQEAAPVEPAPTQLESQGVLNPADAHMFIQEDFYQAEPDVVAAVMTQLSLKSGLKEWGDKAYIAAESEMKQLHFRNTFKPMHWKELTDTQRQIVLESHMFLKEKRDGKIKGRTVAGGNKQRDYISSKEDASSPTVATESVLLLSCIIDAEEERDVAVIDIPNAFIQTRVEDEKDGDNQDSRSPSRHSGGDRPGCLQVLCYNGQERGKTVAGTMPERPIWNDGCKSAILSQVHQESDGNRIRDQSVWSMCHEQNDRREADDDLFPFG
jgi:hypothetical protein